MRAHLLVGTAGLLLVSLAIPNASAQITLLGDPPGDDMLRPAACSLQTTCSLYGNYPAFYKCSLLLAGEIVPLVLEFVGTAVANLYPQIKQTECAAKAGIDDDVDWWDNEFNNWEKGIWCWAWGGPNRCPEQDPHYSVLWFVVNKVIPCSLAGWNCPSNLPPIPPLTPPPPPFP